MKHMIKSMKHTVPHSGHSCCTSSTLLLAILILLLAGPADAREYGRYHFLAIGDVSGEHENSIRIRKKMSQLESSWPPGMELDISFFKDLDFNNGDGAVCFPGGPGLDDGHYEGPFVISQNRNGTAQVDFYFVANGTDGSPDHKYVLQLFGTFIPANNFPPTLDTEVVMSAPAWLMLTEGRGQARKVTCIGDGDSGFAATVIVTRVPKP